MRWLDKDANDFSYAMMIRAKIEAKRSPYEKLRSGVVITSSDLRILGTGHTLLPEQQIYEHLLPPEHYPERRDYDTTRSAQAMALAGVDNLELLVHSTIYIATIAANGEFVFDQRPIDKKRLGIINHYAIPRLVQHQEFNGIKNLCEFSIPEDVIAAKEKYS